IRVANSFANDDFVTYHAPPPVATFGSKQVDVGLTGGGCDEHPNGDSPGADNIFIGKDVDAIPNCLDDSGLSSGDLVTYTASDAAKHIGGIFSGFSYYVIRTGSHTVQLADNFCHAVGYIGIDNGGRTGSPHLFQREGRDLIGSGSGTQTFVLDISPGAGTQQLIGIGGATGGATAGDEVVSASASGAGGGLINVATASSSATAALTISTKIGGGANLTAGTLNVTTHGWVLSKAVSSNDGGGAISIGNASANDAVSADNTIDIAGTATLTSNGDLLISARSELRPSVAASTNQGGLVAGSGGETSATVDYTTATTTAGHLTAAGTLLVDARRDVEADGRADAD